MAQLDKAARELERIGIPNHAIGMIAGNDADRHREYLEKSKKASESTEAATASGASFGGGLGILASLAVLAIPGAGPVIAGGGMLAVLTGLGIGAVTGGFMGALRNMGISHEEAPLYEEAVRRGVLVLIAKVDDEVAAQAAGLMESAGGRDLHTEADTWRAGGWRGPHSDPHPYVLDDTIQTREMPETVLEPESRGN